MKKGLASIIFFLLLLLNCRDAEGILVNLSEKEIEDAVREGERQGFNITKYLKKNYSFGEKNVFEEYGVIRTKWTKLAMLSGLLADKARRPSEEEKERILKNTDLQIDINTFGNKIDFAKAYRVHLVQKGKIIEPEKVSAGLLPRIWLMRHRYRKPCFTSTFRARNPSTRRSAASTCRIRNRTPSSRECFPWPLQPNA